MDAHVGWGLKLQSVEGKVQNVECGDGLLFTFIFVLVT